MLEPATPNLIPDHVQPPPLPIIINDELEFEISGILNSKLTTILVPASYCILSIGQGMRALMKKLPGSLLLSLDMLPKLLQISTLHIQPSPVLFQVSESGVLHFLLKSYYLKFTL